MYSNGKWISKAVLAVWIVLGASAAALAQQQFVAPAPDEARDLFNAAQKFYDEDRLNDAEKRFKEVVQRFPKNEIADRADYYLIRTLNEQGNRTEALIRIDAFPKTYPKSKWQTDVEELRIRLTNKVSPIALRSVIPSLPPLPPAPPSPVVLYQGQAERDQQQAIRDGQQSQSTDPEVALQQEIMRAVFQNNPERAIEIATDRLKGNPADPLVLSSLNMVAQSRSAQALPMLLAIAKNATNAKARKDAIFWISQSRGDKDTIVDTLVGLLPSLGDEEAESAAFSLGQIRNEKATNALATMARDKSKSQKIRDNALFWIGQTRTTNRISILEDIYKNSMDSSKTRLQTLFALSQTRDAQAVPLLGNVASTDPDIEVRKQAVFWLGQIRSPEARQALENLLQKK